MTDPSAWGAELIERTAEALAAENGAHLPTLRKWATAYKHVMPWNRDATNYARKALVHYNKLARAAIAAVLTHLREPMPAITEAMAKTLHLLDHCRGIGDAPWGREGLYWIDPKFIKSE